MGIWAYGTHCWAMICLSECQTIASKCAKFNAQSNRILCLIGAVDRHISRRIGRHISWYIGRVSFQSRASVKWVLVELRSSISLYIDQVTVELEMWPIVGPYNSLVDSQSLVCQYSGDGSPTNTNTRTSVKTLNFSALASIWVSEKLPTYTSPKLTLILT